MSDRGRWMLIAFLVLLGVGVVAGLAALFVYTHERREHKLPLPPNGEAATNPLYALRQTLRADGVDAQSRLALQPETFLQQPADTVLLHGDPSLLSATDVNAVLGWVAAGGHLLVRTPPGGDEDATPPPLLRRLGVSDASLDASCESLRVAGQDSHIEFCRGHRFELDDDAGTALRWRGEDGDGYVHARIVHGRGRVDVLADFDFMDNTALDEVPHQALARQLLAPNYGKGTVHLVYAVRAASLWRDLARRGWPVWVPLALGLAAWLWRRGQRFGPWRPSPAGGRRSLLEHVRASGDLLYRYGRTDLLHGAAREAFLARLRRRDPSAAALAGDARVAAIAARLQLPHTTIRDALTPPEPRDRHAFFARVRTLIQMRNRL